MLSMLHYATKRTVTAGNEVVREVVGEEKQKNIIKTLDRFRSSKA